MAEYTLYPGFHFRVEFLSRSFGESESRFQTVGGLEVTMDTESVREGGENRFEHKLPTKTSFGSLSLKRGLLVGSDLIAWCFRAFDTTEVEPIDLIVHLLNEEHEPVMSWNVKHAWPIKWAVSEFNAESNELAVETLEMQYLYFTTG